MALMSAGDTADSEMTREVASLRYSHHDDGSCSAHPGFTAIIGASDSGKKAEATHFPLCESTRLAFTDELPIS
jgi:hypothetical protein